MLQHAKALSPFYQADSRILILGSFPSVKSRQTEFFYAHPQNRLWKVLGEYFRHPTATVQQKKELLSKYKLAMWDIIAECDIDGSKDSSVTNAVIADINIIIDNCPIEVVLCNGKLSFDLTTKYFGGKLKIPLLRMPSTSPQNVSFDIGVWRTTLDAYFNG